jgi:hypothetical protein
VYQPLGTKPKGQASLEHREALRHNSRLAVGSTSDDASGKITRPGTGNRVAQEDPWRHEAGIKPPVDQPGQTRRDQPVPRDLRAARSDLGLLARR